MIDLIELQGALDGWPDASAAERMRATAPRLASALMQAADGRCGPGDLAGLLRGAIRTWQETHDEELPAPLRVPSQPPWPDVAVWARSGIDAVAIEPGRLVLRAVHPFAPLWATAPSGEALDAFPALLEQRRPLDPVPGDPIWTEATGLPNYQSLEQREAVRALLTSAEDATVLVLLPTGSGKSLVGLLAPLVAGPSSISVVVVPTVSLALDQERGLRSRLRELGAGDADNAFAFHGGLSPTARLELLDRVRAGGQRVVFTSPEALFGALGDALAAAAQEGRFGQFVIDEAHIVAGWGAEFRPDFQMLAGFRRRLTAAAATGGHQFRTVLMTATANRGDVETLGTLFADHNHPLVAAGAVALRPELSYVAVECADAAERSARLEEALQQLPRPVFVYATRKDHVAAIAEATRGLGVERLVTVTGDSTDEERRAAIRALRGDANTLPDADVAVGTSAFGLGIDVNDVRCVVHACLPETLDRYYQEVGRSGRDGRAALGLMLWTVADENLARDLSTKRIVGVDLARKRWAGMSAGARMDEDGVMWVGLEALRIGLFEETTRNEQWNSRTLSSMARAGLVSLVGSRRVEGSTQIGVRPLRTDLESSGPWHAFEQMRRASRVGSGRSLAAVLGIARGGDVCGALLDEYTVLDRRRLTADLVPHHTCGGCAGCSPPRPVPVPPMPLLRADGEVPAPATAGWDRELVAIDDGSGDWGRRYAGLIEAATRAGIRHIVCTPRVAAQRAVARALRLSVTTHGLRAPFVTRIDADPRDDLAFAAGAAPILVLLAPDGDQVDGHLVLDCLTPPVAAVLPASHPHRIRTDMTLKEIYPGGLTVAGLQGALAACLI